MARQRIRLVRAPATERLAERFAAIRAEVQVPEDFPPDLLAEAEAAVRRPVASDADLTGLPFVTVDPAGARDLDQAMHLARDGDGFRVDYAIADVPAFVDPDGAVARE